MGMDMMGLPILPELVNAFLALVSGFGLLRRHILSLPLTIFTAGMWSYGTLGGVSMVLERGLDFTSPFGTIVDAAILFPSIAIFPSI
jgi:hypothetical protein